MTRTRTRLSAALVAAFLFLAAFMVIGAPSAAADTGPVVVETAPPAPSLDAACQAVDPDSSDVWSYISTPDPVGGTTQVDAFVPEGYVIGATGKRYWSSVEGVWELTCPTTAPAPVDPAPVDPAPVPVDPDTGAPITELPATGPDDYLWVALAAGTVMLTAGTVLLARRAHRTD